MADAIATINGRKAMAFNGQNGLPWHELGKSLNGLTVGSEMQVEAGLNWEVLETPLFRTGVDDAAYREVPDHKALVRSVDNHYIATVQKSYKPIQNSEMFDFAEALMGEGVRFETAGALYEGRVVWALAVIEGRKLSIPGDHSDVLPYMVLSTGHDALRAFTVHNTPIRVVCANTLDAAVKDARRVVSIRHTKNAPDRIALAKAARGSAAKYFDAFEATAKDLVSRPLTMKDVEKFLIKLIPGSPEAETAYKSERQRQDILGLLAHSENLDGLDLTGWKVYQAVAEWADHDRVYRPTKKGTAEDARAMGLLNGGTSQGIKDKALTLLTPSASRGTGGRFVSAGSRN